MKPHPLSITSILNTASILFDRPEWHTGKPDLKTFFLTGKSYDEQLTNKFSLEEITAKWKAFGKEYMIKNERYYYMINKELLLNDKLIQEAIDLSGIKTKDEVLVVALQEFVAKRKRLNLLDIAGKIEFQEGYDYKKCREGI
ncbi:conserved hypothetical protein [Desulfamplus magnetovallimortis]|uniref:Uncharacterized protein n=1 Tax=Desulfamplus magnetovallimortis TaxID=1246637 RepID=A0A1W1HE17_9BACT|nr:type II toxin-antitoxin system VapB family antitoxin [Desulfamplus magnetovallimortis]SLM30615.1 conserved hypothetical protein [Desulfamplus magnetovallimortis]